MLQRIDAWASAHRDPARPLLWLHAPSVGEGLQLKPIIERLRHARPELQIAYTHFSPSAASLARSFVAAGLADVADYLPFDTGEAADHTLDALRPKALVFGKLDVWPVLVTRASQRGIHIGLVNATLSASSGRRGASASALLRTAYASLDAVGAIDAADAERLVHIGVRPEVLAVTGDARYDQVWDRSQAAQSTVREILPVVRSGAWRSQPVIVAGSTWPPDERVVLEGWRSLRDASDRSRIPRLVIAPHVPTESHTIAIERWAAQHGVVAARMSRLHCVPDLLLIDRVGVLADLYAAGDIAYVGGGFHAAGIHSVLEPAACAVPVLVGPGATDNRDAQLLVAANAAQIVRTAAEFAAVVKHWLADCDARHEAGARARGVVQAGLGAADRSAALIDQLLALNVPAE